MKTLARVEDIPATFDVAVIGGGPAGLAAAATAAGLGLEVCLFDENPEPGGQIYRGIASSPPARRVLLGADYARGARLLDEVAASNVSMFASAMVWMVSPQCELGVSLAGASRIVRARRIILATGAIERPFPIPGWTLPGVMTAGAAQGALKGSGIVPEGRFALAGTGPLLWLLASQLLAAGAKPEIILDTTQSFLRPEVLATVPGFLASPYLAKGLRLMREVRRHVRVVSGVTELAALGENTLTGVSYRRSGSQIRYVDLDALFLHQGVVPNVNMANAIGCEMVWDAEQFCWKPATDSWGRSSVDGISIAGDGAGISGAEIAACLGRICAYDAAYALDRIDGNARDEGVLSSRSGMRRYGRGRAFLNRAFRPTESFRRAAPETIVCRCEEVTGRQITETLRDLGDVGPNQVKSYLRCGMGPCQGRMCGLTVAEMIAAERGLPPAEVGYFRLRFPIKPIPVSEIASLPYDEEDERAVIRN